ncbi:hypothetical protein Bca101_017943 [Brassica carinata]
MIPPVKTDSSTTTATLSPPNLVFHDFEAFRSKPKLLDRRNIEPPLIRTEEA